MLYETFRAFQDRVEYSRTQAGTWQAEFHGPIDLRVEAPTVEKCRRAILDALDEAVAAWLAGRTSELKVSALSRRPG
jgi:hypothetical protein